MDCVNLLGMATQQRQDLAARAGAQLSGGDERLARLLLSTAARQLSVLISHHADHVQSMLKSQRHLLELQDTRDELAGRSFQKPVTIRS